MTILSGIFIIFIYFVKINWKIVYKNYVRQQNLQFDEENQFSKNENCSIKVSDYLPPLNFTIDLIKCLGISVLILIFGDKNGLFVEILSGFRIYYWIITRNQARLEIKYSHYGKIDTLKDAIKSMLYVLFIELGKGFDLLVFSHIQKWFHDGYISIWNINMMSEIIFFTLGLYKFQWKKIFKTNVVSEIVHLLYSYDIPSYVFFIKTIAVVILSKYIINWNQTYYLIIIVIFCGLLNSLNCDMEKEFVNFLEKQNKRLTKVEYLVESIGMIFYLIEIEIYVIYYHTSRGYMQKYYTDNLVDVKYVSLCEEIILILISLSYISWTKLK